MFRRIIKRILIPSPPPVSAASNPGRLGVIWRQCATRWAAACSRQERRLVPSQKKWGLALFIAGMSLLASFWITEGFNLAYTRSAGAIHTITMPKKPALTDSMQSRFWKQYRTWELSQDSAIDSLHLKK